MKAVASRRASSRRPFSTYVGPSKEEDERRLEALLRANEAKRAEVQMKINRAVGVGWLCEEYIEMVGCPFYSAFLVVWLDKFAFTDIDFPERDGEGSGNDVG